MQQSESVSPTELAHKLKIYRMNQEEYERVCGLLGREPRGIEWALFSALWSEHCSYKSSKVHLKKIFNKSPRVVESFGENAGVVDLGGGERIAFKIESHNHPSYIEPYQGAETGVGGILRDIFTMGARPIALADYLCFGEAHASRMTTLVDGVVRGIGGYGNCVGVPTITGQTEFHSSYNNNILVNAMAVGLFRPGEKIFLSKAKGPGNWVVYVGAKTGRDGVHGASMASESFGENSTAKKPTVQIGDPFFEKLLIESCLEVMEKNLVVAIQDMGAAGLTSSSFEMAAKGGVGFKMQLDEVPLRDPTMTPEEILLSESQERMLLVCEPNRFAEIQAVFSRWGLDACKIGEVTEKKTIELRWKTEVLTEIDPGILVDEAPQYQRPYSEWKPANRARENAEFAYQVENAESQLDEVLRDVRGTSREWIYRQYDQRVGASTARDCRDSVGVLRLPDSGRGLGVVLGCRPHVMRFDAHVGGADAVAYPALELAAKGFETLAVTDCLNFGNPEKPHIMSEFVAALDGMNQICSGLTAPIISGNVSFYNETLGQNVTSTPSTGLVGLRANIERLPRSEFTGAGDVIYMLRLPLLKMGGALQELKQNKNMGQGEENSGQVCSFIKSIEKLSHIEGVTATRVVGKFGLAYALARMANHGIGCNITDEGFEKIRTRSNRDELFHEYLYEVLFTVAVEKTSAFEQVMQGEASKVARMEGVRLGLTGGPKICVGKVISYDVEDLKRSYEKGWGLHFESLA